MRKIIFCYSLLVLLSTFCLADSIYKVGGGWKNIDGNPVELNKLKGRPIIITMVYTTCQHACPMIMAKLKKIDEDLKKNSINDMTYVLASFDPEKDTPKALKKYVSKHNYAPAKWLFLSADSDSDARKLSVALGISYKSTGDGDFAHSNIITLLDKEGRVVSVIDGLQSSTNNLVEAAKKLQKN